jgi:hypothetical protein
MQYSSFGVGSRYESSYLFGIRSNDLRHLGESSFRWSSHYSKLVFSKNHNSSYILFHINLRITDECPPFSFFLLLL